MRFVGVDPGKEGAIASLGDDWQDVLDMPFIGSDLNMGVIAGLFGDGGLIVIEHQQSMPKQGVVSVFSLGEQFGALKALAYTSGARMLLPRPSAWKKEFGLLGKDKNESRLVALQLFPEMADSLKRVKDHGRAEALLLAEFGRRQR